MLDENIILDRKSKLGTLFGEILAATNLDITLQIWIFLGEMFSNHIKSKIAKCDELEPKAKPDQLLLLRDRKTLFQSWESRLSVAMDIMEGKAFYIHSHGINIGFADEDTSKLLDAAEKRGAKVESMERTQRSTPL